MPMLFQALPYMLVHLLASVFSVRFKKIFFSLLIVVKYT